MQRQQGAPALTGRARLPPPANTPLTRPPLQTLGLVFVAVYQRTLRLLYVDELLERANRAFSPKVGAC